MQTITKEDKRRDLAVAFDEACDLVAAGHPDRAQYILERAFPKPQARHIFENIFAVFAPTS